MATGVNKIFSGYQPCQLVKNHRRFRDYLRLHHQGCDVTALSFVIFFRFSFCISPSPWWWRQQAPLKHRQTFTRLHGATTQKTARNFHTRRRENLKSHCNSQVHPVIRRYNQVAIVPRRDGVQGDMEVKIHAL
jgi:hypothetical protein